MSSETTIDTSDRLTEGFKKLPWIADAFNPESNNDMDRRQAAKENARLIERMNFFITSLDAALVLTESEKSALAQMPAEKTDDLKVIEAWQQTLRVQKLEAFMKGPFAVGRLSAPEMMRIFNKYKEKGSFIDMIQFFSKTKEAKDIRFGNSPVVLEQLMVALNKVKYIEGTLQVGEVLISDAEARGKSASSEVYAAIGKVYKMKFDAAKKLLEARSQNTSTVPDAEANYKKLCPEDSDFSQVEANKESFRKKSFESYEKGYQRDFGYYPGINTAYMAMEETSVDDPDVGMQKAFKIARLVDWSVQNAGGLESGDYWCVVTALEVACMLDKPVIEIQKVLARLQTLKADGWQLETTLENMERIRETRLRQGSSTETIDAGISGLLAYKQAQIKKEMLPATAGARVEKTDASVDMAQENINTWFGKHSYMLKGAKSDHVLGNFRFGGGSEDIAITRFDVETLNDLNRHLGLDKVSDPEQFKKIAFAWIREQFQTEKLEDLHGAVHAMYDAKVKDNKEFAGHIKPGPAPSSTSVSLLAALGIGDCRPHERTALSVFAQWQEVRTTTILNGVYEKIVRGGLSDSDARVLMEKASADIAEIMSFELRGISVNMRAPIQMEKDKDGKPIKYKPLIAPDGSFVQTEDGAINDVEDHTMTIMVKKDANGNVVKAWYADSFYNNVYKLGEGEIDLASLRSNGDEGHISTFAAATNPSDGSKNTVEFKMKPTGYSELVAAKPDEGYFGDPSWLGHPTNPGVASYASVLADQAAKVVVGRRLGVVAEGAEHALAA